MTDETIHLFRQYSRNLARELGLLQLNKINSKDQPTFWHTLVEINAEANITISKLSQVMLISLPTLSRIVSSLLAHGFISVTEGIDKRERFLNLTERGLEKVRSLDTYSETKIKRAFRFLSEQDRDKIIPIDGKFCPSFREKSSNS